MATLSITDRDGVTTTVESDTGQSVMEVLQRNKYGVAALCGGCCSCATCHIYVAPGFRDKLEPAADDELALVEASEHFREGASRLSCQIPFTADLDGIALEVAPED